MTFDWKEKEIKKKIYKLKTKRQFDSTQTCFSLTGDIPSFLEGQYFDGAQSEFNNTALASSQGVNVFK